MRTESVTAVHPALAPPGFPAHRLFTPIIMQHLIGNPGRVPANPRWGAHVGITP